MPRPAHTLIALNHVQADRADDFEASLRTVVVPAVRQVRPDLDGLWRVLRAEEVDDGVVVFAFLIEGGTPEDWELEPVLEKALGPQGAEDTLREFSAMLRKEQYGWSFRHVDFDGEFDGA